MKRPAMNDNDWVDIGECRRVLGDGGHVPEKKIGFKAAKKLYMADFVVMHLITGSSTATLDDFLNVSRALMFWNRYWFYNHANARHRERSCDAFLALAEVLRECGDWSMAVGD
jgi:hypothetical protein